MLANFMFWIEKNEANGKHYHDGRYWTYNSIDAFTRLFPFWSAKQIRRIVDSLENKGLIIKRHLSGSDRTTWYALGNSICPNGQIHLPERENAIDQMGECIDIVNNNNYNTDTNINADGKPNNAEGVLFGPYETKIVIRPKKTSEGLCLFENSRYYDFERFAECFTAPEFAEADIVYYYHAVADWSARFGKKMKDWIATARNFMRNDARDGKLKKKAGQSMLSPDAIEYLQAMAD